MKRIPIIVAILVLSAACDDGGGGDPQPVCEETCTNAAFDDYDACAASYRDCALACTGFSDTACLDACNTTRNTCSNAATATTEACSATCPCSNAYDSCIAGCAGDATCEDGCYTTYETCLGKDLDAINACMGTCNAGISSCSDACVAAHSDPPDYTGFINCVYGCYETLGTCNRACY